MIHQRLCRDDEAIRQRRVRGKGAHLFPRPRKQSMVSFRTESLIYLFFKAPSRPAWGFTDGVPVCRAILASTPTNRPRKITPEPPPDTRGKAIPFVGTETVTTAMFIAAWMPSVSAIPNASRRPVGSGQRR